MQIFCFDLDVDYETVVASKSAKPLAVMALINYLRSRGRLAELVERARQEFPSVYWNDDATPSEPTSAPETTPMDAEPPSVPKTASDKASQVASEPAPKPPRAPEPLRVFLCHSSGDKLAVRQLYRRLQDEGMQPWLDEEDILPGKDWDLEIRRSVRISHLIIVCLSNSSISKAGYIQKEIKLLLDVADEQPEGTIFVIRLKLEECDVPERLRKWQWVNLFDERGYARLLHALRTRADELGITLMPQVKAQSTAPTAHKPVEAVKQEPVTPSRPSPRPAKSHTGNLLVIESPFHFELVCVPAGEFLMGSDPAKDKDARPNEQPQHKVYVSEFYIGKYPITNAQYEVYTRSQRKEFAVPGGKENHPVVSVSWHDAVAFCKWLSQATGREFTLPTEAQWEKAARCEWPDLAVGRPVRSRAMQLSRTWSGRHDASWQVLTSG